MAAKLGFGLGLVRNVEQVIDILYNRARYRLFGKVRANVDLRFKISPTLNPPDKRADLTLKNIFDDAAETEGGTPNEKLYRALAANTEHFLDAHCQLAKARVVNAVQSCLHDKNYGASTEDLNEILKEQLVEVLDKAKSDIQNVVENETNKVKNMSTLDAISQMDAVLGVDDPTVYFGGPVDQHTCPECLRMFYLADGITPRVWKASELSSGYFHRHDQVPSISGCHPNCRHSLCSTLIGYGFVGGHLTFIEPGYDVWKEQRGIKF